jgi:hypothetical protein
VPERAVEALPGRERGRALVRLVLVVEEEDGHASMLARQALPFIGADPEPAP